MLLVYPLRELLRFLPVLIGLFVAGYARPAAMDVRWQLLGIVIPIGARRAALLHDELPDHRGPGRAEARLINRHRALDPHRPGAHRRASPPRRSTGCSGVTTVRIGTGTASTDDEDAPRPRRAAGAAGPRAARGAAARARRPRCRRAGRAGRRAAAAGPGGAPPRPGLGAVRAADQRRVWCSPRGAIGSAARSLDGARRLRAASTSTSRSTSRRLVGWLLVPVGAAACVARGRLGRSPSAGYVVTNWGFTLTHTGGAALVAPAPRAAHHPRDHASTTTGSAASRSASRSGSGWPVAAGCRRSSPGWTASSAGSSAAGAAGARARSSSGVAGEVLGTPRPDRRAAADARPAGPHPALHPGAGPRPSAARRRRAGRPRRLGGRQPWVLRRRPRRCSRRRSRSLATGSAALGHALVGRHFVARSGSLFRQREALVAARE